jgi:hypothetical protein
MLNPSSRHTVQEHARPESSKAYVWAQKVAAGQTAVVLAPAGRLSMIPHNREAMAMETCKIVCIRSPCFQNSITFSMPSAFDYWVVLVSGDLCVIALHLVRGREVPSWLGDVFLGLVVAACLYSIYCLALYPRYFTPFRHLPTPKVSITECIYTECSSD